MASRKKKWKLHESAVALKSGGKVQPGSGAGVWNKGDVKTSRYCISCKQTEKKSYALKLTDWDKAAEDAFVEDRIPLMSIDIRGKVFYVVEQTYIDVDDEGVIRI